MFVEWKLALTIILLTEEQLEGVEFSSQRKMNIITFHLFICSSFMEHLLSIRSVPDTGNTKVNETGSLPLSLRNPEKGDSHFSRMWN